MAAPSPRPRRPNLQVRACHTGLEETLDLWKVREQAVDDDVGFAEGWMSAQAFKP